MSAPTLSDRGIPLAIPEISGNEWRYVKECLDGGWVSSVGAYVDRFEQAVAARVGRRHGIAVVNGTAALHLALMIAGVERGDEVVVPALTFIAPANAVRYLGAHPVFVDVEPRHAQIDVHAVADFLASGCQREGGALVNRSTGRRVRALLPVHLLGHPCDMAPLNELARRYGLAVVEDATESLGATYGGRPVGTHGDFACFSFNGNKLITTGGGGMLVTNDDELARRARYLSTQAKDDPIEYVHGEIGWNYRLTNVLAAIGCAQLERLDEFVAIKRRIARSYQVGLAGLPGIRLIGEAPWARSSFWLSTVVLDRPCEPRASRELHAALGARGIQTRPLWQPLHRSPAHLGSQSWNVSVAEDLYARALSLPCSVGLTDDDVAAVIEAIRDVLAPALARAS